MQHGVSLRHFPRADRTGGLGYYRRARSLLAGAQTVMSTPEFKGGYLLSWMVRGELA